MNYNILYSKFIESRPIRVKRKQKGYHLHHIIPRAFGGALEDPNNLISLTPREHFIAHRLLVKCQTDRINKWKMIRALHWFTDMAKSSRLYERYQAVYFKDPDYIVMDKIRRKSYWTDARRKARSEAMKKQWQDPSKRAKTLAGMDRPEAREKNRQSSLRHWQDPEFRKKVKEGHKRAGTGSWMTSDQARQNRLSKVL